MDIARKDSRGLVGRVSNDFGPRQYYTLFLDLIRV